MARSNLLKQYRSRISRITKELEEIRRQRGVLGRQKRELEQERSELLDKVQAMTETKELDVTEHAILRYLERVRGIDMDDVVEEIIPPDDVRLQEAVETLATSNGVFPVQGSHKLKVRNGRVVTVLPIGNPTEDPVPA